MNEPIINNDQVNTLPCLPSYPLSLLPLKNHTIDLNTFNYTRSTLKDTSLSVSLLVSPDHEAVKCCTVTPVSFVLASTIT